MTVAIAAKPGLPVEVNAGRVKGYCSATVDAAGPKLVARKEE